MPSTPDDPSDAIAAALARLRGRRGPRPPWMEGAAPHGAGPHAHGHAGPHGHSGDGGEHVHADGTMHGFGGRGPWGRGGPGPGFGAPPWAGGGGRFGGPARMRLLEALAAASHPLSVGEIADAVGVDQPRASSGSASRRTRVALTDAGTRLVRGFRGERREAIDSALAAFTDEERAELARLLTKLADSWPGAN